MSPPPKLQAMHVDALVILTTQLLDVMWILSIIECTEYVRHISMYRFKYLDKYFACKYFTSHFQ